MLYNSILTYKWIPILPMAAMSPASVHTRGTGLNVFVPGVIVAMIPVPGKVLKPSTVVTLWSTLSATYCTKVPGTSVSCDAAAFVSNLTSE